MFDRILVAVDESHWAASAAQVAGWIASKDQERIILSGLHVVNVTHFRGKLLADLSGLLGFEPVLVPAQVEDHYKARGVHLLQRVRTGWAELGLQAETILAQGGVVDRILHHGQKHDLIVVGLRGETEAQSPHLGGGSTERVVRLATTSVLVTNRAQSNIQGIALAYDGSAGSIRALELVIGLARLGTIPVHVIHVERRRAQTDALDDAKRRIGDQLETVSFHQVSGEPHEVLPAEAKEHGCDVLALGYRGHSRMRDIFLGRTTEWLLGNVSLGLLVAR